MTGMWIGPDENLSVGDKGFLINTSNPIKGTDTYFLRDTPAYTNQSHEPKLHGWCGSWNDTSTRGCGMWEVTRCAKNGRAYITEIEGWKLKEALEEFGYPELWDGEDFVKYVGAFIAGKTVAVYKHGDQIRLSAETVGGGALRVFYDDEDGKTAWRTVADKIVSVSEYKALKDTLVVPHNEGATTCAFLEWMGYPITTSEPPDQNP